MASDSASGSFVRWRLWNGVLEVEMSMLLIHHKQIFKSNEAM